MFRWRNPHQVLRRWPEGEVALGPLPCIFAHWDADGDVRPTVLHQLHSLVEAGCSVVFVTNSGRLRPEAEAALRPLCAAILVRRNVGYDFGAWREGLELAGLPRPGQRMLMLMNDSVYGPLRPLGPLLQRMDFGTADIWGATDSPQIRPHLQSYMLAAAPRVVESQAWRNFWAGVHPTGMKNWLVRAYEIGFTRHMRAAGFTLCALWPYESLPVPPDEGSPAQRAHAAKMRRFATAGLPLNPTSDLWRQLLRAGYPFVKRELLRDNPGDVADVAEWRDEAARVGTAGLAEIEADVRAARPRRQRPLPERI